MEVCQNKKLNATAEMGQVDLHIHSQPSKPLAKIDELETSYCRKGVTDQKCLLNELGILHVPANEVQHTKAMERLSNVRYYSRGRLCSL